MNSRSLSALLLCSVVGAIHADECEVLQPKSVAYETASNAMSGHFPVDLESIQYCGVYGWSKLFTATAVTYQTHKEWSKTGSLRCWQLSQHEPDGPYSCERKIISTHRQSGISIFSEHEIPLEVVDEATFLLSDLLAEEDEIESMGYVPVHCGGSWSIGNHGYILKLKSTERGMRRQYSAKKKCSPTPCLWKLKELEPERWVN